MPLFFNKIKLILACLVLSVMAHLVSIYSLRMFGTYDFAAPVNQQQSVVVDLTQPTETIPPPDSLENQKTIASDDIREEEESDEDPTQTDVDSNITPPARFDQQKPVPKRPDTPDGGAEKSAPSTLSNETARANSVIKSQLPVIVDPSLNPLNSVGDFLASKNERLTYIISIMGLPIGNAELEAKSEIGEVRLSLRVKSNTAISNIFQVDDVIETRHIAGIFILTKTKQHEGAFKSDEQFTINQRKKRVSWFDNIGGHSLTTTIPTGEVLDTLSAIYYLRNRQLQIGTTESLHIYDGGIYANVPVEILRRETIRLPNLQEVDTLVIRPLQKTAGIFRRAGDILIWMTDDVFRVPVKIVTSIALGTVTIDLVSAESLPTETQGVESK